MEMIKDAKLSDCGKHRFWLYRCWEEKEDDFMELMLIGLNPSTANADNDDPTIRRIIGLAKSNGYDAILMTNLFSFITAYPSELDYQTIDELNLQVLKANGSSAADVCFCWGNFDVKGKEKPIIEMFPNALCFGKNKNGSPKHPLYLKADTELVKFRP